MVKILAVSDTESPGLESIITRSPEKLKSLDVILSCGDLSDEYIEFLVDGLNRDLLFVYGNHGADCVDDCIVENPIERMWGSVKVFQENILRTTAGQNDLHGRVAVFGEYLVVGFGGSMWYSGRGNEYAEKDMARVVRQVERKIRLYRLQEKILQQRPREIIVISHAPVFGIHDGPDRCHTGFKCFGDFIKRKSPILWMHGHIHLRDPNQNQISVTGKTTIVNTFGHKFIKIDKDKIQISSRYDII